MTERVLPSRFAGLHAGRVRPVPKRQEAGGRSRRQEHGVLISVRVPAPASCSCLLSLVDFSALSDFQRKFPLGMGQVEMGDCLRNGQEAVNVISAWEQMLRDVESRRPIFWYQTNHFPLPLLNRPYVAIEQFFKVMYRRAMATMDQSGCETSQASETDQIFGQRSK